MTAVRGTVNRAASKPKVGFGSLSPVHPNYANGRNEYIGDSQNIPVNGRYREIRMFLEFKSSRSYFCSELPLIARSGHRFTSLQSSLTLLLSMFYSQ